MGVTLTYSGGSQEFPELFVKGFDDPDEVEFFVGQNVELIDGTLYQTILGFRRIVTLGLLPVDLKVDRRFLAQFLFDSAKVLTFNGDSISVVLKDPSGYSTEWLDGLDVGRYFEMQFREKVLQGVIPVEWTYDGYEDFYDSDGLPVYDSDGLPVQVKKVITI
jgi:hypothetical protein